MSEALDPARSGNTGVDLHAYVFNQPPVYGHPMYRVDRSGGIDERAFEKTLAFFNQIGASVLSSTIVIEGREPFGALECEEELDLAQANEQLQTQELRLSWLVHRTPEIEHLEAA